VVGVVVYGIGAMVWWFGDVVGDMVGDMVIGMFVCHGDKYLKCKWTKNEERMAFTRTIDRLRITA
jgi:hypothetical protein